MTPEKWKEHVRAGHYPARRDCLQCVMHGATGHRHTRIEHPSLFCLTVDITGPFRTQGEDPGARGDRAKAAKMKYLLVAKFTIPESYVTGKFGPTGSDPLDEEVGSGRTYTIGRGSPEGHSPNLCSATRVPPLPQRFSRLSCTFRVSTYQC